MNREENNRLIAQFMGYEPFNFKKNMECYQSTNGDIVYITEFDYHSNWNSIMPVVEKIERLEKIEDVIYGVSIWDKVCKISTCNDEISWCRAKTKIEATHNAVVEFIKWHNEQAELLTTKEHGSNL